MVQSQGRRVPQKHHQILVASHRRLPLRISRHRNETALQKSSTRSTLQALWVDIRKFLCYHSISLPTLSMNQEASLWCQQPRICSYQKNLILFISYSFQSGNRPQDETGDNIALASGCSTVSALKAAEVEDCANVICHNRLLKPFILSKNYEVWSTIYRRQLGIEKCWAWSFISARLILRISRQAIYDSEVNQF